LIKFESLRSISVPFVFMSKNQDKMAVYYFVSRQYDRYVITNLNYRAYCFRIFVLLKSLFWIKL
jgi:hypothetical protein